MPNPSTCLQLNCLAECTFLQEPYQTFLDTAASYIAQSSQPNCSHRAQLCCIVSFSQSVCLRCPVQLLNRTLQPPQQPLQVLVVSIACVAVAVPRILLLCCLLTSNLCIHNLQGSESLVINPVIRSTSASVCLIHKKPAWTGASPVSAALRYQ